MPMDRTILTLVTRDGCHLCEEMAGTVRTVIAGTPVEFESRDVDAEDGLRAEFGLEVPVLLVNGRKAFKYRVTPAQLRRRLSEEERRRRGAWWRRLFRS